MSRHKPPPSKAMADALRAAVGKMKAEDREAGQEDASSDTPSSSGGIDFAAAVEAAGHVRRLKHKQPSGLARSRRKRVRTEPLKKKPPRRRRSVDKTPSMAAIFSAYKSKTPSKNTTGGSSQAPKTDITQPFILADELLVPPKESDSLDWWYVGTASEQYSSGLTKTMGTDIVVGIDFGTTYTKVVIRETGSRQSWAVPFTNSLENPYLLPGNIIESPDCYEPSVTADLSLGSLKLPLLTGGDNESAIASAACFIALVIRHSRAWFLEEKAQEFPQAEFDWSFHMGIPASSYDDKSLISNFDQILKTAVLLSKEPQWGDQEHSIKKEWLQRATQRAKEEEFYDQVRVYPEIAAQLHGYIRSDRWDSTRRKFLLVDVGSGTVDSTVVNVTLQDSEPRYNFLQTSVDLLGTIILHRERLKFLRGSAEQYKNGGKEAAEALLANGEAMRGWQYVPDSIVEYLASPCDQEFIQSCDSEFQKRYYKEVSQLIHDARRADPLGDHRSLPTVLCGGGCRNGLYEDYIRIDFSTFGYSLERVAADVPSTLSMPDTDSTNFHRLSVAFGLSFDGLADFLTPDAIKPLDLPPTDEHRAEFISKDQV